MQAAVLHPPGRRRRAGDGRALRDLARPDPRRRRPAPVPVDLHGAHHHRRGLGRAHPRPDAAAGGARPVRRLARPAVTAVEELTALLVPAAPGRLEAYPVAHAVNNVRNNGPELLDALPADRGRPDDRQDCSGAHPARRRPPALGTAPGTRSRRCCSATAPAAASTPPTSWRWPRPAAQRHLGGPGRAALAGGRQEARAPPRGARRVLRGRRRQAAGPHPAGGRRPQRRRPVGGAYRARARRLGLPRAGVPAAPARPAGAVAARTSSQAVAGAHLVVQGERDAFGGPRSSRRTASSPSSPAPTTASRSPERGPVTAEEAMAHHRRGGAGVRGARRGRGTRPGSARAGIEPGPVARWAR